MECVAINVATTGDAALVAADPNSRIKVVAMFLVCAGAVTVQFKSAATVLTGAMSFAANGGIALSAPVSGDRPVPLFQTAKNEALNITLGGNVQVSGSITFDRIHA